MLGERSSTPPVISFPVLLLPLSKCRWKCLIIYYTSGGIYLYTDLCVVKLNHLLLRGRGREETPVCLWVWCYVDRCIPLEAACVIIVEHSISAFAFI